MRMIVKLYLDKILAGDITLGDFPKKLQNEVKKELEKAER